MRLQYFLNIIIISNLTCLFYLLQKLMLLFTTSSLIKIFNVTDVSKMHNKLVIKITNNTAYETTSFIVAGNTLNLVIDSILSKEKSIFW